MPVFTHPVAVADYLHCAFRSDLNMLVARWLRQPTTDEMHAGYHTMLDLATTTQAQYWLVDVRRREATRSEDTNWMMHTFFPLLARQLTPPVLLAYLFMPTHLTDLVHNANVPPLTYFDGRPYQVQRFIEEQGAINWLLSAQNREG